jgi:ATP-dependent DNA helicase RecQ
MTKLRSLLDDNTLKDESERCGKCSICIGEPLLPSTFNKDLADEAVCYLKHSKKVFVCKTDPPNNTVFPRYKLSEQIPDHLKAEEGRVLAYWMDAGWGPTIFSNKKDNMFGEELVNALAEMIEKDWQPWKPKKSWGWVTCVPSTRHQKLVPDFAYRLAGRLKLPFRRVVVKMEDHEPQKSQKNNFHRCRNLDGAFKVKEDKKLLRGPVLLVDDIVRSTWTVTVIAALLKQAGSGPVFPVGLARIVTED